MSKSGTQKTRPAPAMTTAPAGENLPEFITRAVREWSEWSPAERRGLDMVAEEILSHCRAGTGNYFIRSWCERILTPRLRVREAERTLAGYAGTESYVRGTWVLRGDRLSCPLTLPADFVVLFNPGTAGVRDFHWGA